MPGGKKITIGYKYFWGIHAVLATQATNFRKLVFGEDGGLEAWSGDVTTNSTIYVNKPNLFGGKKKEGGVQGNIDVMFGGPTQAQNTYLVGALGTSTQPAWRNVVSLVFNQTYLAAINPYLKPWKVWVSRLWQGWNPSKAIINTYDLNPAHIAYETLTNTDWGMGKSPGDVNDASFEAAAQTLYDEGLGLSMIWADGTRAEDFLTEVMEHIDGALTMRVSTGKYELSLVRDDYSLEGLPILNKDNVIELSEFQRPGLGEIVNEVVVIYEERDTGIQNSVTVQNLAMIEAQDGEVVSVTKEYLGVHDEALAMRLAMRDLRTYSTPLSTLAVQVNRYAWNMGISDPFKFTWEPLGITDMVFRVTGATAESLESDVITLTAVQDVFKLDTTVYTAPQGSSWVNPAGPPAPPTKYGVIEAPYFSLANNFTAAELGQLTDASGFGMFYAVKPQGLDLGYNIFDSTSGGGTYTNDLESSGLFSPYLQVDGDHLDPLDTTIDYAASVDVLAVNGPVWAKWEDEIIEITSVDTGTKTLTVKRGVLDTLPKPHNDLSEIFVMGELFGLDNQERFDSETTYYKLQTFNAQGITDISAFTPFSITYDARWLKPYPPGNVKINTEYFPVSITGDITVTWAHRDRVAQTVDLESWTTGNIGPEAGTEYDLKIYNALTGGALIKHELALTGTTYTYTEAQELSDWGSNATALRVELFSKRDGFDSMQTFIHAFTRP